MMNDKLYPIQQTIWNSPGGRTIRKGEVGHSLFCHAAVEQLNARMANGLSQLNCDFPFYSLADEGADGVQEATT